MTLHVLFLSDNFPPEGNAPASRTYEHCLRWVRSGARVTVITGAPNFPEGVLFQGYRNRWYVREDWSGIRVIRVKTYISANEGFARRTLDYLSFMATSFLAGLVQPRFDVIVGTSPQFFTVCSAWMLSVFRRRPFVFELRDLWPASIQAVGAMAHRRSLRALVRLEEFLYRRAAAIVALTGSFREELVQRGVDGAKISVIRNGVDLERFRPGAADPELVRRHGLEGCFVVGYIGTQGLAHALDNVLDTAAACADHPDIVFLLVGSGARHEALKARAATLGLRNVRFLPRQDKQDMPALWNLCHLSLVHLKDDPLFTSVIPSKIFESMGMGIPMIVSVPAGEATRLVDEADCGVSVPPENPRALREAVLALRDDPVRRHALAAAALRAADRYSRDRLASDMLEVLVKTAGCEDLLKQKLAP